MEAALITLISTAGVIAVAIVGAIGAWLGGRRKGSADIQTVVNNGFKLLIDQNATLIHELQEERQAAQIEQSALHIEVRNLRDAVTSLESHVDSLEGVLRMHNIPFRPLRYAGMDDGG